jgi:glyoxylase-like metal-dependent hydrolase (beta-lactamase superfamily II)
VRHLLLLLWAIVLASCAAPLSLSPTPGMSSKTHATNPPGGRQMLVDRAVGVLGGAQALAALRSAAISGTAKQWEPEQSLKPGGEARFAAQATFNLTFDFVNRNARVDWDKRFAYPAPRNFRYSEVVTPLAGYVAGIDSNARNAQSVKMAPPAHTMSGVRLAVTQRELRRISPTLLLDMYDNPGRLRRVDDQRIGTVIYPAVSYTFANHRLIVLFDPQSGLPARVRTLDFDTMMGDVNFDVVLGDWQPVAGVRVAVSQRHELNGRAVAEVRWTRVQPNVPLNSPGMTVPEPLRAGAAKPSLASSLPYQWVIRRQYIGTYLDSENVSYDTSAAVPGLRMHQLAPGVMHVVGGTHNALVVNMHDHLIVFDAPVSDWQSNWTIKAAQAQFGQKPVRYLVLTHHHMDHAGGLRAYLAQGATLVVGRGAGGHYRRVLDAPATRNPDLAPHNFANVSILEVANRYVMTDGKREVQAYVVDNPHAEGMLLGYVTDARIGFVTDLWSPGRAPLPARITPMLAAVVSATRRAGVSPLTFAGGHGGSAEYAPLVWLARQH